MVTASQVKDLREKTGAGMMDCKKVLTETDGDMEKAIELLRERGIAKAAKKSGRVAAEGLVEAYVSEDGKTGAIVEVNSETDFVAKNEEFKTFVMNVAKQIVEKNPIAAARPEFLNEESVPAERVEKEKEILKAQTMNEGKPEAIAEKIVLGRIGKFYSEICLVDQAFVKDPNKKVSQMLKENDSEVIEFARFEKGEGIEKKEENFAEEVMNQLK